MAHNNTDFRSITGAMESTEPASANTSAQRRSPSQQRQASSTSSTNPSTTTNTTNSSTSTSSSLPQLRRQTSASLLPSANTSPQSSRNVSPIRKDVRPGPLSTHISTQPSAAAIQRALSAASVPQIPAGSVSEAVSRLPRAPKGAAGGGSGDTTPQWPLSPRLKSPPPSAANSRRGSSAPQLQQKKMTESSAAPSISVQGPTPQADTPPTKQSSAEEPKKVEQQQQLQAPPKPVSRGPSGKSTLETVQEATGDSISESPAAVQAAAELKPLTRIAEEDKPSPAKREGTEGDKPAESGSESAGTKSDGKRGRRQSLSQSSINTTRSKNAGKGGYPPLSSVKSRQGEGKQNMTVETETVQSIPQSALGASDRASSGRNDNGGSVRLKPSNETIRPKKERKRASHKTRSINQGTVSSKADIFEARVASAVDEANTSDSDETFVYESNPPEPQRRPRHHSRTPSVTSSHSMADQQRSGIRNFGDMMDERRVAGKRSMKFSNNSYNDVDSPDSKNGTVRSHQARHYGKFGRGGSHASMYDPESPFTQASKLRSSHMNSRSRPNSPRSPQSMQQQQQQSSPPSQRPAGMFGRKLENSFDFDGEGADDERTPLVGTVRTPRNARQHRRHESGSVRSIDEYYGVRARSRCGRLGGCLLGVCVFVAVVLSAVAFLMMSNRPMYDVSIDQIQNVLASEEEIMLDLNVRAVNPNALGVTMMYMDVNVFARSTHVGSSAYWRQHGYADRESRRRGRRRNDVSSTAVGPNPWQDLSGHWHAPSNNVGPDPIDPHNVPSGDVERDAQTMLLGRIFHFDQALLFEGSPIKRHPHYALGQLRLTKPGNKTESGGSERWEHMLQHSFELIIRGVLKYQLPISSRTQNVAVGASVLVHPEDGVDEGGNMRVEVVQHIEEEDWEWMDLEGKDGDEGRVEEVD